MSLLVGRVLGQYEIIDVLGRGGMATVYLGRQTSIDRHVAVKVLPPHPALDDAFKERFQLEAKTIGSLQNPHILPLYDYGTFEDVLYLVMQYVEGGTLEDLIDHGAMAIKDAEKIIRAIASGLDYAHNRGVIHRDIKPGNILLQDGHPLLADFGMVKMVTGDSNLTGTAIVGTPSYMAPEQGQGLEIDHRVDVYALSAMSYEMLTGQQPFEGTTPMQMILAHINAEIPDVRALRSDLSQEIADVINRGLAKRPEARYQSAGEFAEALSRAIHSNDDSLAEVQKEYPIESSQQRNATPTVTRIGDGPTAKMQSSDPNISNQQPTQVIVRDNINPIVLMGGFGLIALVIVVVAVLLINNQNNTLFASNPTATNMVIGGTDVSDGEQATSVPTPIVPTRQTFGEVRFSTQDNYGDRIEVRLRGVMPPGSDTQYAAWLRNSTSNDLLGLGRVVVDSVGDGTATYTDSDGRMLAATYNEVFITRESTIGEQPAGETVYTGVLPVAVTDGLTEIFVTSPDGLNDGSLIDGALTEVRIAEQHAGLAAGASNIGGLRTHAEHTINILLGEQEDYDGNGSGENPGRGIGVFFFLDRIDDILTSTTSTDEATSELQSNAEFIRVCTQNVRGWAEEVVELELEMIAGETLEAVREQTERSTVVAEQIRTGVDLNLNGIIEAFEGECGLDQIDSFGLQFARMDLFEAEDE
ncbi:MAG: serine/threonine protein kinase [Anaerolineae bacterium]